MKKPLLGFYMTALLACVAAPALATPISALYDTGVDANGTPLANGAGELHYSLVSVPSGPTAVRVVTSGNGYPIPPWLGDDTASAWIGPNSDSSIDGPVGNYDYRTTFSLSGLNPATASISGLWAVDNVGINILINGVSTGLTNQTGFAQFQSFMISSGFIAGLNTLDFIVQNGGTVANPTGLRVEFTSASATSIPEPMSFGLLGVGLLGTVLLRRRVA